MPREDIYRRAERLKTVPLLVGIFLIGFGVVYISHGPRLSDPDAWFQYRMALYVIEDGGIPDVYPLAYYPEGRKPWVQDTLVLPYFFAYTYKLVAPLGVSTMGWAMMFPGIFGGGFAAVFLYFAVKELFGARVGLLSAVIYAFIPLNLTRVYAGTIDKEVLYGFFVFPSLYFFLRAWKNGISFQNPRSLAFPVLSGVFYGLAYANWTGGSYIALVLALAVVVYSFFKVDKELFKALLIVGLTGPLVMELLQPPKYSLTYFTHSLPVIAPIAVSFLPLFSIQVTDLVRKKHKRDVHFLGVMGATVGGFAGLMFLIGKGKLVLHYVNAVKELITLGRGVQQAFYMSTVSESQPSTLFGPGKTVAEKISHGDFYFNLHLILLILPISLVVLIVLFRKGREFPHLFTLAWVISGFIAALQGKRLMFFLAPSAAVATGVLFVYFYDILRARMTKYYRDVRKARGKRKYVAEGGLTHTRVAHILLAVIIFGVPLSALDVAVATMGSRQSDLPRPWYEALMWTKENTPENSVIFFWWDYGYYFQAVANRYTIADGGANVPRNVVLANMFSSPEEEAMKFIKRYVDYEEVPTYMVVSYEEFGKSGAINRIATRDPDNIRRERGTDGQLYITSFRLPKSGSLEVDQANLKEIFTRNRISTYYVMDVGKDYLVWVLIQVDNEGNYHPEWADKLLVKLLPFNNGLGQGLKHFELVYRDPWNYVFIYRIK